MYCMASIHGSKCWCNCESFTPTFYIALRVTTECPHHQCNTYACTKYIYLLLYLHYQTTVTYTTMTSTNKGQDTYGKFCITEFCSHSCDRLQSHVMSWRYVQLTCCYPFFIATMITTKMPASYANWSKETLKPCVSMHVHHAGHLLSRSIKMNWSITNRQGQLLDRRWCKHLLLIIWRKLHTVPSHVLVPFTHLLLAKHDCKIRTPNYFQSSIQNE